jgi:hypothetical protein
MPETSKTESGPSINELMSEAEEAEKSDPSSAIDLYKQVLKKDVLQTRAYDRLMILLRKEKNYKKELSVIDAGIKAFEKFYETSLGKPSKKIRDISEKLNKAFHLTDKEGTPLYRPEPIDRWQKRKEVVEKKIEKAEKKNK